MIIELELNRIENEWWFELGISVQKTVLHPETNMVLTIGLGFACLYIRW